jgi:ABC-type Fe3+/spermidine/putrescine transport system ATPase subunit
VDARALRVCDLAVQYDGVRAVEGATFEVQTGEQVTLLGPSGSGKSSILRAVGGLETPHRGGIWLLGEEVFNSTSGIDVAPERRGVSMVFQSYAIWPHMTVFENVAYPLKVRRRSRREIREKVERTLALVGMERYEGRPAPLLSGGQQQRVALARALVFDPKIVLFDEPLSNLDARLRARMGVEIKRLQAQLAFTSLYVTHDQEEAFLLSDRIVLLNAGRIEQISSPYELFRRPASRFAAEFISSSNIIPGHVAALCGDGIVVIQVGHGSRVGCASASGPVTVGQEAMVYVNPSFLRLSASAPAPDRPNAWRGAIELRTFVGDTVEYVVGSELGRVRVRTLPTDLLDEGDDIIVSADQTACHVIV